MGETTAVFNTPAVFAEFAGGVGRFVLDEHPHNSRERTSTNAHPRLSDRLCRMHLSGNWASRW